MAPLFSVAVVAGSLWPSSMTHQHEGDRGAPIGESSIENWPLSLDRKTVLGGLNRMYPVVSMRTTHFYDQESVHQEWTQYMGKNEDEGGVGSWGENSTMS